MEFKPEIKPIDFATICDVSRANISALAKRGKRIIISESGKINIHDPVNSKYLMEHGKSILDVQEYIKAKEKPKVSQTKVPKKTAGPEKTGGESAVLVKCVDNVISDRYDEKEAKIIKNLIFKEVKAAL